MTTKRSFVEAFLGEEAREENASKRSTRIALARAKKQTGYFISELEKNKRAGEKNNGKNEGISNGVRNGVCRCEKN